MTVVMVVVEVLVYDGDVATVLVLAVVATEVVMVALLL